MVDGVQGRARVEFIRLKQLVSLFPPIRFDLTAMDGGNAGNAGAITSGSELQSGVAALGIGPWLM